MLADTGTHAHLSLSKTQACSCTKCLPSLSSSLSPHSGASLAPTLCGPPSVSYTLLACACKLRDCVLCLKCACKGIERDVVGPKVPHLAALAKRIWEQWQANMKHSLAVLTCSNRLPGALEPAPQQLLSQAAARFGKPGLPPFVSTPTTLHSATLPVCLSLIFACCLACLLLGRGPGLSCTCLITFLFCEGMMCGGAK